MGAPVSPPIITLYSISTYINDGNNTSYNIVRGSTGSEPFLDKRNNKHSIYGQNPYTWSILVFNWYTTCERSGSSSVSYADFKDSEVKA
jgi:hypothetical protein